MPLDAFREANRKNWEDRVPVHLDAWGYSMAKFIDDPDYIADGVENQRSELGSVEGKTLLHLQCQLGTDALSWARLGATVTGMDFSEQAITAAKKLFADCDTPGRFFVAELYESRSVLDEQFDIVYTGGGALIWLPDIKGWAKVVARFLKPGCVFYILEGHPMMWSVSDQDNGDQLILEWPYFEAAGAQAYETDESYTGTGNIAHTRAYNFTHGLGETIDALIQAGLELEFVHEHRVLHWQAFPLLERGDEGLWKLPPGRENHLPLMHSIRAHKPE